MFRHFFKAAIRNISRQKVFSFINITGLALSLTAVWVISLYVADEMSYDAYHKNANRVYRVVTHGSWEDGSFDMTGTSGNVAPTMAKDFPEVETAIRLDAEGGGIIRYGEQQVKDGAIMFTDPGFFDLFTIPFIAGNADGLAQPNNIILTRSLAAKLFDDPQSAVNKVIEIDKNPVTITGVTEDVPENSHFSFHALRSFSPAYQPDWSNLNIYTYLLLKPNARLATLEERLPGFVKKYLSGNGKNVQFRLELQPLRSIHLGSHLMYELGENHNQQSVFVLGLVGLLIVIIALINYINITTARASVRLREVAVRRIIGSGKNNLVGLFLTESFTLITTAAIISVFLAMLIMPFVNEVTGKHLSVWRFGVASSMAYLSGFTLVAGCIGGLYPAFFLSRLKTIPALKNSIGNARSQVAFRKSLVLFQFCVTVILITASLVIYRQLNYVSHTDLGFNKNQVVTFHLDSRSVREKVPALREMLLKSPGIEAVASAGNPIGNNDIGMMDYSIEKNGVADDHSNLANGLIIDPDFIPAMQISLLEGRNFSKDIATDSAAVIVNEALLQRSGWATGVGRRIDRGRDANGAVQYATIIGVVKDYHIYSLQHKIEPMIMQLPEVARDQDNIYLRLNKKNIDQSLEYAAGCLKSFDAAADFDYHFIDKNFQAQYEGEQNQATVLLGFTLLTIIIACLGLFGLVSFTVSQRVKEIGIRKVLGASVANVTTLLTGSLLKVILVSMIVSIPVSWLLMNKWLQDFAYRISLDWWIFAVAGAIVILIALLTLGSQAFRAAIANPAKSLRTE